MSDMNGVDSHESFDRTIASAIIGRMDDMDRRMDSQDGVLCEIRGALRARSEQVDRDKALREASDKRRDRNLAFIAALIVGFVPLLTKVVDILLTRK